MRRVIRTQGINNRHDRHHSPLLRCHGLLLLQAFPHVRRSHKRHVLPRTCLNDIFRHHHSHPDRRHHHQCLHVREQLPPRSKATHHHEEGQARRKDHRAFIQHGW